MSTNISTNILKNFIVEKLGSTHVVAKEAQKHGINQDQFNEANVDENNYLELDEIVMDTDLYKHFATMYVTEEEQKAKAKSEEQEKEEQVQIKDKNGAGV